MRILVAPDKFKDALTAMEVAEAIKEGIKLANAEAQVELLPLADGGEGTAELLTGIRGGQMQYCQVLNPLLERIDCNWGYLAGEQKGFIELAEASGLRLVPQHLRNPMHTTTFGSGELIKAALAKGVDDLVFGLGGSATNEGGAGMAAALGYRFLDRQGDEIFYPSGKDLIRIHRIKTDKVHPAIQQGNIRVRAACDVSNPLLGPTGATYIYGPQKGATKEMLPLLEGGLKNLAKVIQHELGVDIADKAGSGAAGGAGAGVLAFLGGALCSGTDLILDYSNFNNKIKGVDLLITGEGKLDATSLQGKLIGKLCSIASRHQVPVIAFCGTVDISNDQKAETAIKEIIPISSKEKNLQNALKNSGRNLRQAAYQYFKKMNQ